MFFTQGSFMGCRILPVHRLSAFRAVIILVALAAGINAHAQKADAPRKEKMSQKANGAYSSAPAQKTDTAKKEKVNLRSNVVYAIKTDTGEQTRFIGDAVFQQGTDTLYCDSLYQHKPSNIYEAFGNVRVAQLGGTQGTSNYLRYTAGKKIAFMSGNVSLTDGKNKLLCEELTYDLGTKTGVYDKGGTLYSDSTTVSSNTGVYYVKSKESRFKGNVHITDPQYKISSEDLGYNTETKFETFYAHSIVTSDSGRSILETSSGTYDSKKGIAHFLSRSSIWDNGQYIEGDLLNYNKVTGFGLGTGNVISIDTQHHAAMYCGHLEYYQRKRVLWATVKPVLRQINGKDTLYMRADTFYSAPMIKVLPDTMGFRSLKRKKNKLADSLAINKNDSVRSDALTNALAGHLQKPKKPQHVRSLGPAYKIPGKDDTGRIGSAKSSRRRKHKENGDPAIADTASADTIAPLYFIGYHHVKIFSDSLQGKCDSVCYTRSDSTIRMMYAPVVWAHSSQITGDTILLHLDSSELRSIYVPNNALVVSLSGPPAAKLYDQVQGKTLTAYLNKNTITHVVVFPNAESIYYSKDEKGAYLGMNQSKSERMRIHFEDRKIAGIKFEQEVKMSMTPMEQVDIPNAHLSRFKWLIELRPKTKEELFK